MAVAGEDTIELRGQSPKSVIAIVDAIAIANRVDRIDVVNAVLLRWARKQAHTSTVVANVTQGNPPLPDSNWSPLE